jgi:hypothetical protein
MKNEHKPSKILKESKNKEIFLKFFSVQTLRLNFFKEFLSDISFIHKVQ